MKKKKGIENEKKVINYWKKSEKKVTKSKKGNKLVKKKSLASVKNWQTSKKKSEKKCKKVKN